MKTAGRKRNIPMYAAGVLLCLTLLSMYMVSGLYARYTTTGSAVDSARTAAFYLKAKGSLMQYLQADVIPGENLEKTLQIVNDSEVKMEYTMTIRHEIGNLPLELLLKKDGTSETFSPQNGTISVMNTLSPGQQTESYTLVISWAEDTNPIDSNLAYMGMLDYLTVSVNAVQVD